MSPKRHATDCMVQKPHPPMGRPRYIAGVIVTVACLLALVLGQSPWFRIAENYISDIYQIHLSSMDPPSDDIVIVGIDEETLSRFAYRSPIDRGFLAELIRQIDANAPRAVAIDLLLDTETEASKDRALISALRSASAPIFVAYGTTEDGLTAAQMQTQERFLADAERVSVVLARDRSDGVVRHFRIAPVRAGGPIPNLAAAVADEDLGETRDIPVRIVYPGGTNGNEQPFTVYPAHAIGVIPGEWFADKYVLIGSITDAIDMYRTPFVASRGDALGSFPGVVVHAFALDQLLRNIDVHEVSAGFRFLVSVALCLAGIFALRAPVSLPVRIILIAIVAVVYLALTALLYAEFTLLLPVTEPLFALLLCTLAFATYLWQRDRMEKSFIKAAWSRYVSPEIVRQLMAHPNRLKLGGEERKVTYIFTDVSGFTTLAESLPPDQVGRLINDYLDGLLELFRLHGATIDKIVGDAVIGLFGAPIADEQQEHHAVVLALEIDRYCEKFSAAQAQNGIKFGETRIGVNTGNALIGNFGGSSFFDYTGLGDTINTAARLESANKSFGTRICVSGSTRAAISEIPFRKIGSVRLAGKDAFVEVFEPVPHLHKRHMELYADAYASMESGSPQTIDKLRNILANYPGDRLVASQIGRIETTGNVTTEMEPSK
ncbi:MAG: adenylate/guanylate cyclase domain-containing protein [Pseudomonadota bacterium]